MVILQLTCIIYGFRNINDADIHVRDGRKERENKKEEKKRDDRIGEEPVCPSMCYTLLNVVC